MDGVLELLGWMGSYQRVQFVMLMLPVLDCALHVMSFIFIGRIVEHTCAVIDTPYTPLGGANDTDDDINSTLSVTYGKCDVTVTNQSQQIYYTECENGYEYSQPPDRSFVSEWDLVCSRDALPEVSQTVMSVGMMLGASLFMALADKYGRKPVYVASHVLMFGVSIATAFVPTFASFLGLRFLLGAFQQGVGLISCIMLVELLPTEKRAFPSQIGCFFWPCSLLCLGLLCYLCRALRWRHTQLVLSAISCYALLQWWIVEESLRWLDVNGKTKEAERLMRKAAIRNGLDPAKVLKVYREDTHKHELTARYLTQSPPSELGNDGLGEEPTGNRNNFISRGAESTPEDKVNLNREEASAVPELSFSTFVKNRSILILTAMTSYMWFADSVAYYGFIMTSSSLSDDFYLGYSLNILAELPAGAALVILINRIGRRYCLIASHLIGGVSLVVAALLANLPAAASLPGLKTIILVISLLGKFGISWGFGVLFLFTPELFPTTIRSTAFGISSFAARCGGMVAPYARTLSRHIPWLPGVIFAVLCLFVPLLVRILPETSGHELPQTIPDMRFTARQAASQKHAKSSSKK